MNTLKLPVAKENEICIVNLGGQFSLVINKHKIACMPRTFTRVNGKIFTSYSTDDNKYTFAIRASDHKDIKAFEKWLQKEVPHMKIANPLR